MMSIRVLQLFELPAKHETNYEFVAQSCLKKKINYVFA